MTAVWIILFSLCLGILSRLANLDPLALPVFMLIVIFYDFVKMRTSHKKLDRMIEKYRQETDEIVERARRDNYRNN